MTNELLIHKNSCYSAGTFIPNSLLQDDTLTWAARGLLVYMLSLPSDWMLNENHLVKMAPTNRDHLRSLVKELERNGYLRRTKVRGTSGRLSGSYWEVWDTKQALLPQADSPLTGFPSTAEPATVEPATVGPSTENPSAYIYNNKQINLNPRTPLSPPIGGEAPQAAPTGSASPVRLAQQPGQQPAAAQVPALVTTPVTTPVTSALVVHPAELLPPARPASIDPAHTTWPQEPQQGACATPAAHSHAQRPTSPLAAHEAPDPVQSRTETTASKKRDPFSSKRLPPGSIPDNLLDCQQLLAEWWEVKARGRTETAFRRACSFLSRYPAADRQAILEKSIMGGHQGLYPPSEQSSRKQQGSGAYSPLATARRATEMIHRMNAALVDGDGNNHTTHI